MNANKEILLIDTNLAATKYVSSMLQYYGYNVTAAKTWDEAFPRLRAQEFDLILCDECVVHRGLGTPLNALREEGFEQPVLIMSDIALKEMWSGCMEFGYVDLINKPVSPSMLKVMAESALKRSRPARIVPVVRLGISPTALEAS